MCSWSSLRGISLKNLEILTFLIDGSGSLIMVQKKQDALVHVGSAVGLCCRWDSMAKR